MSGEEPRYSMVMPFLAVTSKGGPYDDEAYVAGYEMGLLDARLAEARPDLLETTIHTTNVAQADLIAMQHGYQCTAQPSVDLPEWTHVTLRPAAASIGGTP